MAERKKTVLTVTMESSLVHGSEMTIECNGRKLGQLRIPLVRIRNDLTAREVRDAMMGVFMTSLLVAETDKELHTITDEP